MSLIALLYNCLAAFSVCFPIAAVTARSLPVRAGMCRRDQAWLLWLHSLLSHSSCMQAEGGCLKAEAMLLPVSKYLWRNA